MKRTMVVLAVAPFALLLACDDGPTQTFDPSATVSNGRNNPFVDIIPRQQLGSSTAGNNPLIRCTPEKQRRVWSSELLKPIVPIRGAAGLDGTKNLTYTGLSIDEVEQAMCQGAGGSGASFFGEQGELGVYWSTSTQLVTEFAVFSGYRGTLAFTDPVTNDKFTFSMESKPIDVNGQPMRWNWRDDASNVANVTKIYNAMMRVFAPDKLPAEPVTDCRKVGGCIIAILGAGQTGAFVISPLSFIQFYFDLGVDDTAGKDILTRIYLPIQKDFAYSNLPVVLKLPGAADQEGVQVGGKVGQKNCVAKIGTTYRSFIDNCIATSGDTTKDEAEVKKFLSGIRHSSESYVLDVIGIDPEFLSKRVMASTEPMSVQDKDRPEDNDPLQTLKLDQQLNGPIVNDYPNEDPDDPNGPDNHGAGLVNLAYAVLVQQALDKEGDPSRTKHPIGDPACKLTAAGLPVDAAAEGCTGMEGFITTAPPESVDPSSTLVNVALGADAISVTSGGGLAPANNQIATWDDTPGAFTLRDVGLKLWSGSAQRVNKVLGKGKRYNVPAHFREPRAYAVLWMQAFIQYLLARGNVGKNVKLQDVLDAGPRGTAPHRVNEDYFFSDAPDGSRQQFDSSEYIYTDFATVEQPWYDVHIVVDANGGILNSISADAYPMRGERAMLSLVTPAGKPLGFDHGLLHTNIFGSTVLSNGWKEPVKPKAPYLTAYDCASADTEVPGFDLTAFQTACGKSNGPPKDASGKIIRNAEGEPWLKPYKGGFTKTASVMNIGRNIGLVPADQVTFLKRDVQLMQAKIAFKTKVNPFDPSSADGTPLEAPINYIVPTDFTGFRIPVNATRDRFVKEEQVNTTGDAFNTVIGLVPVLKDGVAVPGMTRLATSDSSDFCGEIFVCKSGGDLLSVRMFTPSDVVMEWIIKHPNAISDCQLVIDYWDYGVVLSAVGSLNNGVVVNFTRPSGITAQANNSVVSDVDLFAPGL